MNFTGIWNCFVFEADCVFDDASINKILSTPPTLSAWYTVGLFKEGQVGGILDTDRSGKVTDLKIVNKFEKKYENYRKLIGVFHLGTEEAEIYRKLLFAKTSNSCRFYYHMPWIENLHRLNSANIDLSQYKNGSFNTPDEYQKIKDTFAKN